MSLNLSGMNNEFMNGFSKTNAVGIQANYHSKWNTRVYTIINGPKGGNFLLCQK